MQTVVTDLPHYCNSVVMLNTWMLSLVLFWGILAALKICSKKDKKNNNKLLFPCQPSDG